jgi:hypothetical protein
MRNHEKVELVKQQQAACGKYDDAGDQFAAGLIFGGYAVDCHCIWILLLTQITPILRLRKVIVGGEVVVIGVGGEIVGEYGRNP